MANKLMLALSLAALLVAASCDGTAGSTVGRAEAAAGSANAERAAGSGSVSAGDGHAMETGGARGGD